MKMNRFIKNYATPEQAAAAARHHAWLAAHAQPLRQPTLTVIGPNSLAFERIEGRHAERGDLLRLAGQLGDAHGTAWVSDLRPVSLDEPHTFPDGVLFGDYLAVREVALRRRREQGHLPDRIALHAMLTLLEKTAEGPTAFYKDSNPRNFLFTEDATLFTLDTDDLTLAPFGYDLAKLIATLIMTYGPISPLVIEEALSTYNKAAGRHDSRLGTTGRERLNDFLALHCVLTAPYAGRNGYRFGPPVSRPRLQGLA